MATLPPMDFLFEVELRGVGEAAMRSIAAACEAPGHWPVIFRPGREERRWFGVRKAYPAVLELPVEHDGRSVLSPDARPDADAVRFDPRTARLLAATVRHLALHSPGGLDFRAAWVGSPIERTELVTLPELERVITTEGPNEFTRYRIAPTPQIERQLA